MKNGGLKIFMALKSCFIANMLTTAFCLFHSERDAIICFDYINLRHPNIRVTMEKGAHHKLTFLDFSVDNNDPSSFLTRVYCIRQPLLGYQLIISVSPCAHTRWVSSGLLSIGPTRLTTPGWGYMRTLQSLKNLFPAHLNERGANHYITGTLSNQFLLWCLPTSPIFYFKLPYLGHFSVVN